MDTYLSCDFEELVCASLRFGTLALRMLLPLQDTPQGTLSTPGAEVFVRVSQSCPLRSDRLEEIVPAVGDYLRALAVLLESHPEGLPGTAVLTQWEKLNHACVLKNRLLLAMGIPDMGSSNAMSQLVDDVDNILKKQTTGAGDTFCGSTLNYIAEHGFDDLTEDNLGELLTFANAAPALVTTKKGAIRAMPVREEVEALIRG